MKDKIIDLTSRIKTTHDQRTTSALDNDTEPKNNEHYPTCVRLVSMTCNEERLFLPKGVHDMDKIHEYPEVVYEIYGGDLDSYNFTIEVGNPYDDK